MTIPNLPTYLGDRRMPIEKLYASYAPLDRAGWKRECIFLQSFILRGMQYTLPILSYRSVRKGPALWFLAGVHGEEPAGPNAVAQCIAYIRELGEKVPVVLFPLLNPSGYRRNWRYPDRRYRPRDNKSFQSVSDAEHVLLDLAHPHKPRHRAPSSVLAARMINAILQISKQYPPKLVCNLHEDVSNVDPYIYVNSARGAEDPVAREVVKIIRRHGFKLKQRGKVWNGGMKVEVQNGIVANVNDGSVDELLSAKKIYLHGKVVRGPSAKCAVVVETKALHVPLKKRVQVHAAIIKSLGRFWSMLTR
ncbi:MAG: hypothetical protein AB1352_04930 [Patescibacteria group bacterium]